MILQSIKGAGQDGEGQAQRGRPFRILWAVRDSMRQVAGRAGAMQVQHHLSFLRQVSHGLAKRGGETMRRACGEVEGHILAAVGRFAALGGIGLWIADRQDVYPSSQGHGSQVLQ